jgi:hypothetical protein
MSHAHLTHQGKTYREDELAVALRRGTTTLLRALREKGACIDEAGLKETILRLSKEQYCLMVFVLEMYSDKTIVRNCMEYTIGIYAILMEYIPSQLMNDLLEQLSAEPRPIHSKPQILHGLETILLHSTLGNHGKRFEVLLRFYTDPRSIPECTPEIAISMLADLVGRIRDILSPVTKTTPAVSLLEHKASISHSVF